MKRMTLILIVLLAVSCVPITDSEQVEYILSKHRYEMEVEYIKAFGLSDAEPDLLDVSFLGNKRVATLSQFMYPDNEMDEQIWHSNKINWNIQKDSLLREYYKMSLMPKGSLVESEVPQFVIYRLKAFPYEVEFTGDYDIVSEGIDSLLRYPYGK